MAALNFSIEETMGIKDWSDTRAYLDHWPERVVARALSGLGCRHMVHKHATVCISPPHPHFLAVF